MYYYVHIECVAHPYSTRQTSHLLGSNIFFLMFFLFLFHIQLKSSINYIQRCHTRSKKRPYLSLRFSLYSKKIQKENEIFNYPKSGQKNTIFTGNFFLQRKKLISIIDKYLFSLIEQTFDLHFQCIIFRPICSEPNFS